MRITGGRLRGRRVPAPDQAGVRPTSGRVREALFSILGQDLTGWSMLDGFGGSGLMAFEAASRGAGPVTVVERNRRVAAALKQAAASLDVSVEVRIADAKAALRSGSWDLVFLDPPYRDDPGAWVTRAAGAVGRVLVIEHAAARRVPPEAGALVLDRTRPYGDSALSLYRPRRDAGDAEAEPVAEDVGVVEGEGQPVQGG